LKYIIRFPISNFLFWSDLSKMNQNGSNLIILDFWWNNCWNISSNIQLYSFFDQNGSDLSKIDQTWSNLISDEIIIEIYHQIFKFIYFLIQMDQTWSNWISDEIIIEIYHQIFNFIYFLIRFNQICPKWIKMVQNGLNLIKLNFWWKNPWNISSDFQFYLFFWSNRNKSVQNGSKWIKLDQIGFLMK
jgi:hypothetical protein